MKRLFTFSAALLLSAAGIFAQCSELFFSEYVEGTGNNKALEIYNPTGADVNLTGYQVFESGNGGSFTNVFNLTGILPAGGVYVITTDQADSILQAKADTALSFPSVAHFNGDDALALINPNLDTVDVIGVIGIDPGSYWTVGTGTTKDHTLVRADTVHGGTMDWNLSSTQWIVLSINTFDSIGTHTMVPCASGPVPCSELFFSEYIEGSGNNKGIEIYNPSSSVINLSGYEVFESGNGGAFTNSFNPVGMLNPGDVYVITTDAADSVMQAQADTTLSFPSVSHFNGDDALALINPNGDTVDIIGVIGVDPGSSWPVGSGSTANHTLVRNENVHVGETDWTIGATQWYVFPSNTFDSLGAHTMTPCGTVVNPEVSFTTNAFDVDESAGQAQVTISISNPNGSATAVDVALVGGTATLGNDFTFSTPTTVTFPANSNTPQTINVPVIDDTIQEPAETIILVLQNATNNATINVDTLTITILESDQPIPVYDIADIHTEDSTGLADSMGVYCQLNGVVLGVNLRPSGLQFTLHDSTGGISVFSFNQNFGYTVTEGDSVSIIGTITQYRGLTEIGPDTLWMTSSNNPLPDPMVTSTLDETTESNLVKLIGWHIIDTMQWTNSGSGFNVDITNGTDTLVMRIDNDVDLYGTPAPTDSLLVIMGIGGQYDPAQPYNSGYQVLPRYQADIYPLLAPVAGFTYSATNLDVSFQDTSTNDPVTWDWDFGDGNNASGQNVTHTYANGGSYVVCLTVTNAAGSDTHCDTLQVSGVGINTVETGLKVYPVPSQQWLMIESPVSVDQILIVDLLGNRVDALSINHDGLIILDVSNYPAGIYMLEAKTANGSFIRKFVKN